MCEQDFDRALEILKKTTLMFRDAEVPEDVIPPAMADHLLLTTLAIGSNTGLGGYAARAILLRMEGQLEDWHLGNPPFEEFNGLDEDQADFIAEDFVRTMKRFVWWLLHTLDEDFVEGILKGGSIEDCATGLVQDITNKVQGNRSEESELNAVDFGMIMDRLAAMHLQIRHGPESVNVPGLTDDSEQ